MTEYPFYRGMPPHQRHSDTSYEAALRILGTAQTKRGRVYRYIRDRKQLGATDEEIQFTLNMDPNTERPRRRELQIGKFIVDSGDRRLTRSGRKAVVWVSTETPRGAAR